MNEETRGLFNRVADRLGWLQFKDFGKLEKELMQSVKKTQDCQQKVLSPDIDDVESPGFQIDCARKLILSGPEVDSEVSLGTEDRNTPEWRKSEDPPEESTGGQAYWVSSEDEETDVFVKEVSPPNTDENLKSWPASKKSTQVHNTSSSSDDVFESFLTQMKTPKVQPHQIKVSTGSLKDFIVGSSSDDDYFLEKFPRVLKPKTENKDKKVAKNRGKNLNLVKVKKPSENLSPVFLLQSLSDEDSVIIKSTWRDRHHKTLSEKQEAKKENCIIPLSGNQHSVKVIQKSDDSSISRIFTSSAPDTLTVDKGRKANREQKDLVGQDVSSKQSCLSVSTESSDDDFESLVDKIKKRTKPQTPGLITQKGAQPRAPNTEPVKKQRPASSEMKNTKKSTKKITATPWSMPVSLERRILSEPNSSENFPDEHLLGYSDFQSRHNRVILCPTPGCFLQDLANPASVEAKNFKQKKAELTKRLFSLYNSSIFELKLPEDMEITWNNKMRKTAGYCVTGEKHKHGGDKQRYARIELSEKVCDSADRLRDTLIHELCHAATWLIHGVRDGHGQFWRLYARRSSAVHPELPMVTRCHTYEINYKFTYQCTKCKTTIGRHSKSLDIQRFVCALCQGQLVLQSSRKNGTPARTELTPFAKYVKDNYGSAKKELVGTSHAEIMRKLSADFAKTRISGL
ncbi:uncharacterized protein LOC122789619 [Protopterus annectens]|uniref:uncharacterized protein LOC122789619 n=1 Tax=Protopterus annectens TaxID=7888 RepID=UPI001CF9AFE6|nr:uncharacterized protein LOC122789619 [Protopterus annectens]